MHIKEIANLQLGEIFLVYHGPQTLGWERSNPSIVRWRLENGKIHSGLSGAALIDGQG